MPNYEYKKNAEGHPVFDEQGKLVILEDGQEIGADVLAMFPALKKANGEARDRKIALQRYAPLADVDDVAGFVAQARADKGEVARLTEEMARFKEGADADVQTRIDSAVKRENAPLAAELQAVKEKNVALERENSEMKRQAKDERIRRAFLEEPTIPEKYHYGALSLFSMFGSRFDLDENGQIFGLDDSGEPLYGADGGKYLSPGECLSKYILAHPEGKTTIIKGSPYNNPGGNPANNHRPPLNNPWKAGTINVTEQHRLAKENPELARSLAKEAGIDLRLS